VGHLKHFDAAGCTKVTRWLISAVSKMRAGRFRLSVTCWHFAG